MRLASIAALGVAAYAVFLVASVPAGVAGARVSAAASGRVEFLEARGTLWSGEAKARVHAAGGPLMLDRIQWRFVPARLAAGRIAFDVKAAGRGIDAAFRVARGFSDWQFGAADARVDAGLITTLAPLLTAWRPEGTIAMTSPGFAWDGRELRGEAKLDWKDAGVAFTDARPLGTYRLEASAQGGPALIKLTTVEGALRIGGQGTFAAPGRLAFSGEARAESAQARALEPLLNLLGPLRADGARAIEIRTP